MRSTFTLQPGAAPIQITSIEAQAKILDRTARTAMEIALPNPANRQTEAVLLVPLPDGAVVSTFVFEGAASEPTAQVLPKTRPGHLPIDRQSLRDPALLEFAGYNLIRCSVFPVAADGTQKVRIAYEHLL